MVQIFKSLLNFVTTGVNRYFQATGRADETIDGGKMYQHFGFRSNPTQNTELVTVKYGNNILSVAENDGNTPSFQLIPTLQVGDTILYSLSDYIYLPNASTPATSSALVSALATNGFSFEVKLNNGQFNGNILFFAHKIQCANENNISQPLATQAFVTAVENWFSTNSAALTSHGCTPFVPPVNAVTTALEST